MVLSTFFQQSKTIMKAAIMACCLSFCYMASASALELYHNPVNRKDTPGFSARVNEKIRKNLEDESIYSENYTGFLCFKDKIGRDIPLPIAYYESMGLSRLELALVYSNPTQVLTRDNFKGYSSFLQDIAFESVVETVMESFQDNELWVELNRRFRSLARLSFGIGKGKLSYYLPSEDYDRLQDYETDIVNQPVVIDFMAELDGAQFKPYISLEGRYRGWPDIDMRYYLMSGRLEADLSRDLGPLKSELSVGCGDDQSYGLSLTYPHAENDYLGFKGGKDKDLGDYVSFRFIKRF